MDVNNDEVDERALRQVNVWAGLVGTAIALAMAVIVYIRRRKLPIPESFKKCIEPLKLTLDFLNGQEYAGGAIEDAVQLNAEQLSQIPGLVPPRPPPSLDAPLTKTKNCGCPVPDITCDCSNVRSCGCPKDGAQSTPNFGPVPIRAVGNLPPSLLASNRRKLTDTFLTAGDKSQACSYRLTAFNPSGPKFRIRRKLGGGFAITSGLDDTGPADGNYTIVSPTEKLPGRYVVEAQPNGTYVIQNSESGPPLTKLEEGDYTLTPVHIVPVKSKEHEPNGTSTPNNVLKSKGSKTSGGSKGSKGSKTSQGSKGAKGSKSSDEPKAAHEPKPSDESKPAEQKPRESKSKDNEGSKTSQEAADILPRGTVEPATKAENTKTDENNSPNLSEGSFNPGANSTLIEKEEHREPSAYFVAHTALPGMYKLNYCDTRPNMGPRPIPDGVYPLWDRDATGNAAPSNRSDGVYTLEWAELETPIDETNIHLPQPVSERVVSVISESKPDGSNVTTVTRKTTAARQVTLNAIYPGGRPMGIQQNGGTGKVQSICGCAIPSTDIYVNAKEDCICSPKPSRPPSTPIIKCNSNATKCTCNRSIGGTSMNESLAQHEPNCPSTKEESIMSKNMICTPCSGTNRSVSRVCPQEDSSFQTDVTMNDSYGRSQAWAALNDDKSTRDNVSGQRPYAQDQAWMTLGNDSTATRTMTDPSLYSQFAPQSRAYQQGPQSGNAPQYYYGPVPPNMTGQSQGPGETSGQYPGPAHAYFRDPVQGQMRESGQQGWFLPTTQDQSQYIRLQDMPECCRPQPNMPPGCYVPQGQQNAQFRDIPQQDQTQWTHPDELMREYDENKNAIPEFNQTEFFSLQHVSNTQTSELSNSTFKSGKQVQTIKPKQALQVQPGINIVRRDDNEDVDIVVEMEMEEDTNSNSNDSKFDEASNPERRCGGVASCAFYLGDEVNEEELHSIEPLPERLTKLEESITVEAWRQGMLAQRITENERVLKHVMNIVANLQNDMTNQMNSAAVSPAQSCKPPAFPVPARPTLRGRGYAAVPRRQSAENLRRVQRVLPPTLDATTIQAHAVIQRPPPHPTALFSSIYRSMPPRQ